VPVAGYVRSLSAGRFYDFLLSVSDGEEFLRRIRPDSDKSGAAMRAAPIGLLPTVDDVLHHAAIQAAVTHDTPAGIASAQAAAPVVYYCHHGLGPLSAIGAWMDGYVPGGWARPWRGKVGSKGRDERCRGRYWKPWRTVATAVTTSPDSTPGCSAEDGMGRSTDLG
jgi:hypothetical protein